MVDFKKAIEYKDTKPAIVIKAALDLIHEPGEVFEVRIPKTKKGTISGYFNDTAIAAAVIAKENGKHQSIYATVNPIKPALLARNENRLEYGSHTTTADSEIERRRWFLIDLDPTRPAGISSTDGELELCYQLANSIVDWLSSIGWPQPIFAESGNGVHLMFRVDEPNDDSARIDFEYASKMLSSIFSTDKVVVDTTSFNASRVWKIYGTLSAKGSSTAERPHRISKLVHIPENLGLVTREQLDTMARPLRDSKADEFKDMTGEFIGDMVKWLSDRGQTVVAGPRPMFGNEGQKWIISKCPFNPEHRDPVVGLVSNRPVYRCLHNSCSAFRWKEFREKIDPTYKDPDTIEKRLIDWGLSEAETVDVELVATACTMGRKLDGLMKRVKNAIPRARFIILEDIIKSEKRRFIVETQGENNEKGNVVGLMNRTRGMQQEGAVPMFWTTDYDHRVRTGTVGDIHASKVTETDEISLMVKFHSVGDSWVKQTHTAQVIKMLASDYVVNPLRQMFNKMTWDGMPRLDTWLSTFMGTKDTEYTRAVGRKWLISAVARGMDPGCQVDHMLIFEGGQGIGKSRALRILGGDFYSEFSANLKSMNAQRDMVAVIMGKLIVEMSELATIRRAEMESLKAMLTTTKDDTRLAYERDAKTYPRTCVFAGTTNEVGQSYIADITGARRFWPVLCGECGKVDTEALKDNVDQLWAEAAEAYGRGEDWWVVPDVLVAEEQMERQMKVEDLDPWHGRIWSSLTDPDHHGAIFHMVDEFVDGNPTGRKILRIVAPHLILGSVLGIDTARQNSTDILRVQRVLVAMNFVKTRPSKAMQAKMGATTTYAYDLHQKLVPHLWSSITAAANAAPFSKNRDPSKMDELRD
jgi:hypothetical protein